MKIGVITDSHDNLPNLRFALEELARNGCGMLIHCGDLISPFVTKALGEFPGPVHTVFGNNDGDRFLAQKVAAQSAPNVTHHGEFGFADAGDIRVGFTHYIEYAQGFAASGRCSAAFFGHTHQRHEERAGEILIANPGELLGLLGKPSYGIYNALSDEWSCTVFDPKSW